MAMATETCSESNFISSLQILQLQSRVSGSVTQYRDRTTVTGGHDGGSGSGYFKFK